MHLSYSIFIFNFILRDTILFIKTTTNRYRKYDGHEQKITQHFFDCVDAIRQVYILACKSFRSEFLLIAGSMCVKCAGTIQVERIIQTK